MESSNVDLQARVVAVQADIARACEQAGRPAEAVTLVAISKTHSVNEIAEAVRAGLRHFGENRIEEALPKMTQAQRVIDTPLAWHMVGHVQSRKARYVTTGFALLHSLDTVRLAQRLSQFLAESQRELGVLLEVNVSGEATKQGMNAYNWQHRPDIRRALWEHVGQIVTLPGLSVRGLMTMAPIVEQAEFARPVFVALRDLRDALAADFPFAEWSELSMGMTDDYPVAVEEGATLVRIGRAIFSPRRPV